MSYAKAMRHWSNPRKLKKMRRGTYMGFDSSSRKETPLDRKILITRENIQRWLAERHACDDAQYMRECIRAEIQCLRQHLSQVSFQS